MDLSGAFAVYYAALAVVFMAIGAFLFWLLTSAIPYLWNHIHWVTGVTTNW